MGCCCQIRSGSGTKIKAGAETIMTDREWKDALIQHITTSKVAPEHLEEIANCVLWQAEMNDISESLDTLIDSIAVANGADLSKFGDSCLTT